MEVTCSLGEQNYLAEITANDHQIKVDEPISVGGQNTYPNPTQYLLASLASCTAITMKMYADRKGWNLGNIEVNAKLKEVIDKDGKSYKKIVKYVHFEVNIDDKQKQRLLSIGSKCPISKLIEQPTVMEIH
ncbi:MAG: OsmC family protein [Vicingaceae bacterium]|nr:OsmC family protein [Vicingaceae bacterium]